LSAANEVAVEAFLNGQITWSRISEVIEATMQQHDGLVPTIVEDILHADALARRFALQVLSA
jgi:1-deoxy-D-xylulose-5-phosphate reductoisomerase